VCERTGITGRKAIATWESGGMLYVKDSFILCHYRHGKLTGRSDLIVIRLIERPSSGPCQALAAEPHSTARAHRRPEQVIAHCRR
jgi:hypothetical protein